MTNVPDEKPHAFGGIVVNAEGFVLLRRPKGDNALGFVLALDGGVLRGRQPGPGSGSKGTGGKVTLITDVRSTIRAT